VGVERDGELVEDGGHGVEDPGVADWVTIRVGCEPGVRGRPRSLMASR